MFGSPTLVLFSVVDVLLCGKTRQHFRALCGEYLLWPCFTRGNHYSVGTITHKLNTILCPTQFHRTLSQNVQFSVNLNFFKSHFCAFETVLIFWKVTTNHALWYLDSFICLRKGMKTKMKNNLILLLMKVVLWCKDYYFQSYRNVGSKGGGSIIKG